MQITPATSQAFRREAKEYPRLGTEEHPISIINENEEQMISRKRMETALYAQIMMKAKRSTNPHDYILGLVKTKFIGPISQKDEALRHEIIKFFMQNQGCNIAHDYFCPRFEASWENPASKPTGMALVVHGVDYLDTQKIGNMFSPPTENLKTFIKKILWIDDSNCLVVFSSPASTNIAINYVSLNPEQQKLKAEEDGNGDLPTQWFELKPYQIFEINRQLFARHATEEDMNFMREGKDEISNFLVFLELKEKFMSYLLKKFNCKGEYESLLYEKKLEKDKEFLKMQATRRPQRSLDTRDTQQFTSYIAKRNQMSVLYPKANENPRRNIENNFDRSRIEGEIEVENTNNLDRSRVEGEIAEHNNTMINESPYKADVSIIVPANNSANVSIIVEDDGKMVNEEKEVKVPAKLAHNAIVNEIPVIIIEDEVEVETDKKVQEQKQQAPPQVKAAEKKHPDDKKKPEEKKQPQEKVQSQPELAQKEPKMSNPSPAVITKSNPEVVQSKPSPAVVAKPAPETKPTPAAQQSKPKPQATQSKAPASKPTTSKYKPPADQEEYSY